MAEAQLVNEKLVAGEWLVKAADKDKVPLRAALWVYDSTADKWRLILEAERDREIGTRDFAGMLLGAIAKIRPLKRRAAVESLLLFDSAIFTQTHPMTQRLRPSLGKARSVAGTKLHDVVLYRLERKQAV